MAGGTGSLSMSTSIQDYLLSLPNDHPLQVTIRTYSLALSLSLGPALLSFAGASSKARYGGVLLGLKTILKRELSITGFPFAITTAIGGGAALQALWSALEQDEADYAALLGDRLATRLRKLKAYLSSLKPSRKTFIVNSLSSFLAIVLLQSRRRSAQTQKAHIPWTVPIAPRSKWEVGRTSATLDLTLLLFVRALDTIVRRAIFWVVGDEAEDAPKQRRKITTRLDAVMFWASSARCVFISLHTFVRASL